LLLTEAEIGIGWKRVFYMKGKEIGCNESWRTERKECDVDDDSMIQMREFNAS
jgi:hypothetical protein